MPAEDNITIPELTSVNPAPTTLLVAAIVDALHQTGYSSGKITVEALANVINNVVEYSSALSTFTSKTILGALNELKQSGGGGGSSVTWNQLIGSGAKIAEISINGVSTDIFAPVSGGATYKDITASLTAGQTNVTISDPSILTTSTVDVYTDVFGVNPTAVVVSTGSVVLTFPVQQTNLGVKVRIS